MRKRKWQIEFVIGMSIVLMASNKEQARILAQAEKIKNNKDYAVLEVSEVK